MGVGRGVTDLEDAVLELDVEEVVLLGVGVARPGGGLGGARARSAPRRVPRLLPGEDVGQTGEHRLRGEGQRVTALLHPVHHLHRQTQTPSSSSCVQPATSSLPSSHLVNMDIHKLSIIAASTVTQVLGNDVPLESHG